MNDQEVYIPGDLADGIIEIANKLHPLCDDDYMDAEALQEAEQRLYSIASKVRKL